MKIISINQLLLAWCSFLIVSCNSDEYDKIRAENKNLISEIRLLKVKKREISDKVRELKQVIYEFEALQKKESSLNLELNEIADYHRDLKAAKEYTGALAKDWESATRKSLVGERLGVVRLAEATLSDVEIVDLDSTKVVLKYSGGQKAFNLEELPEPMQKKLIYKPAILMASEIVN